MLPTRLTRSQSSLSENPIMGAAKQKQVTKQAAAKRPAMGDITHRTNIAEPLTRKSASTLGTSAGFGQKQTTANVRRSSSSTPEKNVQSTSAFTRTVTQPVTQAMPQPVAQPLAQSTAVAPHFAARSVAPVTRATSQPQLRSFAPVAPVASVAPVATIAPVAPVATSHLPSLEPTRDTFMDDDDPMICDVDEPQQEWEDIDAADVDNPLCVVEYVDDIYANCRMKEHSDKYRIYPDYMSKQVEINEKMRAILIDWLLDVHLKFRLLPETLYLTVFLIDRFLSLKCVSREKLQLVGVTAMFIASKFEEIYPPECNDFVYISANAYTREEILQMEQYMLNTLGFNLATPTTLYFLRRFSKAAMSDYRVHTLSKFLLELALLEIRLLKYVPSQIAAASVYLARTMVGITPAWTPTLEHYTTYSEASIKPVVIDLNASLKKVLEGNLQAVVRKYSSRKFGEVAKIPVVDIIN